MRHTQAGVSPCGECAELAARATLRPGDTSHLDRRYFVKMSVQNIPVVDLEDWTAGGAARDRFIHTVGSALCDIGFFAIRNHRVSDAPTPQAYQAAKQFFHLPADVKARYHEPIKKGQRGFTGFGKEHAKDSTEIGRASCRERAQISGGAE